MQEMTDIERVCCLCGDVGFADKIYRCIKCHHRFQHSYCSNYYSQASEPKELCEWCQTDEMKTSKHCGSSKKLKLEAGVSNRSQYSSDRIKQQDREEEAGNSQKIKSPTAGAPSPRTKRYKLLKDVMC